MCIIDIEPQKLIGRKFPIEDNYSTSLCPALSLKLAVTQSPDYINNLKKQMKFQGTWLKHACMTHLSSDNH